MPEDIDLQKQRNQQRGVVIRSEARAFNPRVTKGSNLEREAYAEKQNNKRIRGAVADPYHHFALRHRVWRK